MDTPGSTPLSNQRNISLIAHVDAGKTTLSERMLYLSRTIPVMGEVEEGTSSMDYLEEEQKKGITIETGIAAFSWKNSRITFLDTPGHVDFGSEVDSALRGTEGSILIISGRSGIESQTLDVWSKLKKFRIRPLIFINMLDLPGIRYEPILKGIQKTFSIKPFLMTLPVYRKARLTGVIDVLNGMALYYSDKQPRKIFKSGIPKDMKEIYQQCRNDLIDVATRRDTALTADFLSGKELPVSQLVKGIRKTLENGNHVPVYLGSAIKNVGVRQLMNGVHFFIPAPKAAPEPGAVAQVLKVIHRSDLGRIYAVKIHLKTGKIFRSKARLLRIQGESCELTDKGRPGEILGIQLEKPGAPLKPGDWIKENGKIVSKEHHIFTYRPLFQTRIEPARISDFTKVDKTVAMLAEMDPSITIDIDKQAGTWLVSTVGEVQLEVFFSRLKKLSGCRLTLGTPEIQLLEHLKRPVRGLINSAKSEDAMVRVDLDVYPLKDLSTNEIENHSGYGSKTYAQVFNSVLTQIRERGIAGFGELVGIKLVINNILADLLPVPIPLLHKCLMDCLILNLGETHMEVLEPIMRMQVFIPDRYCGPIIEDLESKGGIIEKMESLDQNIMLLLHIPLQRIFGYASLLRSLTKGRGTYTVVYVKHDRVK